MSTFQQYDLQNSFAIFQQYDPHNVNYMTTNHSLEIVQNISKICVKYYKKTPTQINAKGVPQF